MDNATNITINIIEPGSNVPVPDTGLFTHGIGGIESSIIAIVSIIVLLAVATFFIVRRKKGLHITKPSKRTSFILGLLAIITSIGAFTGLTLNSIYNNTNAEEGTLTVNAEDADLTIELGDEPVFAVLPVDVKVAESTPAGYTLTSYTETTGLVSTTDDTNIIPMISTGEGELAALKDNTYGLSTAKPESKDDKTYTLLSTAADNPTFITDKDYKATEANDTTTIYYGFYITPGTPYGTYTSSDIYYNATTNSSKVIFNGNGLYFNNNPEQATNDVEYITGITSNTAKYSHTPNINDEGVKESNLQFNTFVNDTVTIPNAASLKVQLTYGGGDYYGYIMGYLSFWEGSHPDYRANINNESGIQKCGDASSVDGRYYSNNSNSGIEMITTECYIAGDTVTFDYWTNSGGPGGTIWYGYYVVVTGYDADGNAIYLPGNIEVGGEYKDPAQDLPYIFLGWNEDKDATTATYESKNDIELNLPLAKGKTTELYAIWQHATKIHFDGNGSTSGEIPDKLLKPGEGANLCGYYYSRDGYVFNNWNTKPDGSGESYGQCYRYTAPTDQSIELTLYAQWSPATTIVYDGNGGEGDQIRETIRAGETSNIDGNWGYFNKDGYAFSHWNTKPDGSGETYYEGDQFTASDQSTTITLYAQWSPATTIVYDGNGGEGDQIRETIRAGETSNIDGNWGYFNKDGYAFSHWNTKPDGTGTPYYQGDQFTASDQSTTITLYAQWVGLTTITFNGNGSDGGSGLEDRSLAPGEGTSFCNDDNYTRTDYYFLGWNTESDGSGTFYGNCAWYQAPRDKSETINLYAQWTDKVVLDTGQTVNTKLKRLAGNSSAKYYTEDTNVTTIARASDLPDDFIPTDDNIISVDGSIIPVYAWYDTDATTIYYYTESDKIIMNPSSGFMFYNFKNLSNATSIADWDTTYVTSTSSMFSYAGYKATTFSLDLSSWDTSKVTSMGGMFNGAGYNATTWSIGDLSSWDTSNVTDMNLMFNSAGYNATTWSIGDLSSWDTSKVMSMQSVFYYAGYNATTFSLDLSSWNTSNVTSMYNMFTSAGYNATTWSIGDLSSWDTSKVANMDWMFTSAGYNATTFSLDLSSWDTSNVTSMYDMFYNAGYNATTFSLDLSSWDTSKVTSMQSVFSYAGYNATTFSLDLSSWDTSNVTKMGSMFSYAGYNATTFSLDLSSWNTSNVTGMGSMFWSAGYNATTFSLDLSSWDTSKVTSMSGMFNGAGYNATTWSVTIPPKTGDIDNTTSSFYGKNSSYYANPPYNRFFTLAAQANSNTTNTTGSLNSINNAEVPNQDNSSGNRSAYATEDTESTENVDDTSSDTTSTPSRQEPLGEHQRSTIASTEDTSIAIPILIAVSITLGTSALVLLIYKSRQREDE